jgi:sporulation integral membrane protein YtvI
MPLIDWRALAKRPIINLLKLILFFIMTGILFYLSLRAAGLLLPFALALACAMLMEPLVRLLCKVRIRRRAMPRPAATIVTMLFAGSVVGVLLFLLVNQIIVQFNSLMNAIPGWVNSLSDNLPNLAEWFKGQFDILPPEVITDVTEQIESLLSTLIRQLSSAINPIARGVWSTARAVPSAILSVIMFFVGTFYISSWRPKIARFMHNSLPEEWMRRIANFKRRIIHTLAGYLRAQLILLFCVFIIIFVGLSIMRVEYALLVALIIALFDMLPVIGSGLFLNTWAVVALVMGDLPTAIGLFVTYLAVTVGRNVLEPRLVSVHIGLPPLLTMVAMYAGFRLFGILGLIGGPILVVIMSIAYEYYAQGRTLKQILDGEPPPQDDGEEVEAEP